MGDGASMQEMAGGLSAMGIWDQSVVQAENLRQQGQDAMFQNEYTAGQHQLAAQVADIQASQTNFEMRRKWNGQMANVSAVMAMDGTDPNGPSNWAVQSAAQGEEDRALDNTMANYYGQKQAHMSARTLYMLQGYKAQYMANQNATATLANGHLASMGAMMSAMAAAKNSRTQIQQAKFGAMTSIASSALGLLGGLI